MVESGIVSAFPPPPPGAERRIHARKDVLAQVELLRGETVVIACVNNVSLGGAFLLHDDDDVALGEQVKVHLTAGGVDTVQAAKVVRVSTSTPRGFAVVWIDAHARTFAVIERLMRDDAVPAPPPPPPAPPSRAKTRAKAKQRHAG